MENLKDKVIMESSYGIRVTVEFNEDTCIDEMLDGVKTCLLGLGYHPQSIYKGMKEIVEEYEDENCKSPSC